MADTEQSTTPGVPHASTTNSSFDHSITQLHSQEPSAHRANSLSMQSVADQPHTPSHTLMIDESRRTGDRVENAGDHELSFQSSTTSPTISNIAKHEHPRSGSHPLGRGVSPGILPLIHHQQSSPSPGLMYAYPAPYSFAHPAGTASPQTLAKSLPPGLELTPSAIFAQYAVDPTASYASLAAAYVAAAAAAQGAPKHLPPVVPHTAPPTGNAITPSASSSSSLPLSTSSPSTQAMTPPHNATTTPANTAVPSLSPSTQIPMIHKAASPIIVQWLRANYESCDRSSIPRSALYTHYVQYCQTVDIEPVNAASFGKLIRAVFPGLKTRRLGTRGHSKYHYFGIKPRNAQSGMGSAPMGASLQMGMQPDMLPHPPPMTMPVAMMSTSTTSPMSGSPVPASNTVSSVSPVPTIAAQFGSTTNTASSQSTLSTAPKSSEPITTTPTTTAAPIVTLPDFTIPDTLRLPPSVTIEMAQTFLVMYKSHCQRLLDYALRGNFADVEKYLLHFWKTVPPMYRPVAELDDVVEIIAEKDGVVYGILLSAMLPNVVQALPIHVPSQMRSFARSFEQWLATALTEGNAPTALRERKLAVARRFAVVLYKQASLNHLAQAARQMLTNAHQVNNMVHDWTRIDFDYIREQSEWVCGCHADLVWGLLEEFRQFLTQKISLEQWAGWLQEVVNKCLEGCTDARSLTAAATSLILKFSYHCSLIIRDLTIRNAASFASFHLMRSLFDEYVTYLVEKRLGSLSGAGPLPPSSYKPQSAAEGDGVSTTQPTPFEPTAAVSIGRPQPSDLTKPSDVPAAKSDTVSTLPTAASRPPEDVVSTTASHADAAPSSSANATAPPLAEPRDLLNGQPGPLFPPDEPTNRMSWTFASRPSDAEFWALGDFTRNSFADFSRMSMSPSVVGIPRSSIAPASEQPSMARPSLSVPNEMNSFFRSSFYMGDLPRPSVVALPQNAPNAPFSMYGQPMPSFVPPEGPPPPGGNGEPIGTMGEPLAETEGQAGELPMRPNKRQRRNAPPLPLGGPW